MYQKNSCGLCGSELIRSDLGEIETCSNHECKFNAPRLVRIRLTQNTLKHKYPHEAVWGSREALWSLGLNDGLVSPAMYRAMEEFYGELWKYTGDTPRDFGFEFRDKYNV